MDTTTPAPLYRRLEHLAEEFSKHAWEFRAHPGSAFVQDHAYSLSGFARQAEDEQLEDGSSLTARQQRRIARALASGNVSSLRLYYKPFDLPDGWVAVEITYGPGHSIYGGISPEGDMST